MKQAKVIVPVASVWTKPTTVHFVKPALVAEPKLASWIVGMTSEERRQLLTDNLIQTQVLFNEIVFITEETEGWSHVYIPSQSSNKSEYGYPGWIPTCQLTEVNETKSYEKEFRMEQKQAFLYSLNGKEMMELSYQTSLDYIETKGQHVFVQTPIGKCFVHADDGSVYEKGNMPKGTGNDIYETGKQFLDLPYLWAGMSSYGYDCSGFVYNVARANGYTLPRDAKDQNDFGTKIPSLAEAQIGDLLFFAYEEGKGELHHVAFYAGNGNILHSRTVESKIEEIALQGTVYEKELCMIRRFVTKNA